MRIYIILVTLVVLILIMSGCSHKIQYVGLYQKTFNEPAIEKNLKAERRGHILIKKLRIQNRSYKYQAEETNSQLRELNATNFQK